MKEHHHDDISAKKSLGQNFLTSDTVPRLMCEAADIRVGDIVLEIGPGTGALTTTLITNGAIVYAIETDTRACDILTERFASEIEKGQLFLIRGDVRDPYTFDFMVSISSYKVVANIPYYLSGFLLRTILELPKQPTKLVFLMQKEVVARIARDKKTSLLSLSVAVYGKPKYVKTVGKGHFSPQPKVDSAILLVDNIHQPFISAADREHFFTLLHLGFGRKRKQLIANLSQTYERLHISDVLKEQNLKETVRAEDIQLADWQCIYKKLPPLYT